MILSDLALVEVNTSKKCKKKWLTGFTSTNEVKILCRSQCIRRLQAGCLYLLKNLILSSLDSTKVKNTFSLQQREIASYQEIVNQDNGLLIN